VPVSIFYIETTFERAMELGVPLCSLAAAAGAIDQSRIGQKEKLEIAGHALPPLGRYLLEAENKQFLSFSTLLLPRQSRFCL
jgi:hypothetical protein|tara:strand:+ start:336 stop:581 length:246 start_codon:yes stop_codon:yes gene_type:complete